MCDIVHDNVSLKMVSSLYHKQVVKSEVLEWLPLGVYA